MKKQLFAVTALAVGLAVGSNACAGAAWSVSVGVGVPGIGGTVTVGTPSVPVVVACPPAPVYVPAPVCVPPPVVYYPPVVVAAPVPVAAPVVYATPYGWGRPVMVAPPYGRQVVYAPAYSGHHHHGPR